MPVRNRCVKSQIYSGIKCIKVSNYFTHHILIFLHFAPFYYRCISSFSDSMHMNAATMLPFELIPPILQIPLLFQDIIEENLKPFVEEPNCNMRVVNNVLVIVLRISLDGMSLWSSGQCKSAALNV